MLDLDWMLEWGLYKNGNVVRLMLHLLLIADEEGNVSVSERRLAEDLGMGRQEVRTAKSSLIATQKITQKITHGKPVITICKSSEVVKKAQPQQPKNQPKKQPKKNAVDIAYGWVAEEMVRPFLDWVAYKKERRQAYKGERTLRVCYNQLVELSGGNAEKASLIVERSIANNWSGLFPINDTNNGRTNWRDNGRDAELAAQAVRMRADFEAERNRR